jgi:hypothetical protein
MGRCIAIETARARRRWGYPSSPRRTVRKRTEAPQARRLKRESAPIGWSLTAWLARELKKRLDTSRTPAQSEK